MKPTAEHERGCGAGRSSGLGPNGAWEHVQVVTPEMANKLVLNRGAVFTKYSFKQGKGGIRSKSERLVWLSGDNRIMWKDAAGGMPASAAGATPTDTAAPSLRKASSLAAWCGTAGAEGTPSAGSSVASMAVADVVSISTTPPAHYGGENTRSLYIVSKARSLMLEAEDTDERDFWYDQLSAIIHVEQTRQRERRRQAKVAQRDDDVSARCQLWLERILPNFDDVRHLPHTRELCWLGVPTNLRSQVWRLSIGNELQITPELYHIFRSHAQRARANLARLKARADEAKRERESERQIEEGVQVEKQTRPGGGGDGGQGGVGGGGGDEGDEEGMGLLGGEVSLKVLDKDLPKPYKLTPKP
jgi:hypothetical protein